MKKLHTYQIKAPGTYFHTKDNHLHMTIATADKNFTPPNLSQPTEDKKDAIIKEQTENRGPQKSFTKNIQIESRTLK